MTLAIDRFRDRGLRPRLEARAQTRAAQIRTMKDPSALLGYLTQSVAIHLERPRWSARDELAVDLRVIDLLRGRR